MIRRATTFLLLVLVCLVALISGCLSRDTNPAGSPFALSQQTAAPISGSERLTAVEMRIVGDQDGLPGSVRASGLGSVTVRFWITLLNPGNDASPTTTLQIVSPVTPDGTASATFLDIPLSTIIGGVAIAGGRIGSYSSFHGAMDLASGTRNTLLLAPRGSSNPVAILAAVLEQIVASPTLFIRVQPGLAAILEGSLAGFDRSSPLIVDQLLTTFIRANPVVTTIGTDSAGLATRTTTVMTVTGLPSEISNAASATITIGGTGVLAYRYRLDSGAWSDEIAASQPLSLPGLTQGDHQLQLVTKSANGVWQSLDTPSVFPLSIDLTPPDVTVSPLTTATATPVISGSVESGVASLSVWVNSIECKVTVSGAAWTARVLTPLLNGTYNVAAKAVDAAGNIGRDTTDNELKVDTNALTVALSTTATSPTRLPIPVIISFIKDVADFTEAQVTVTNSSKSGFTAIDGRQYRLLVTPAADGLVQVDVAANAAHDSAGTGNSAASPLSLTFDSLAPAAPTVTTVVTPTRATPQILNGTKPADAVMVLVNGNGAGVSFPTPTTWRSVFDLASGTNAISATCRDLAGNESAPAMSEIVYLAPAATPTVTVTALLTNQVSPTIRGTVDEGISTVTVRVNGFDYPAAVTGGNWIATITRVLANGVFDVEVRAVNAVGNTGIDVTTNELTIDTGALLPAITTASNPTNLSPMVVTVAFNRDAPWFVAEHLQLSNGSLSGFTAVSPATFTFNVTPGGQGAVQVAIRANVVRDGLGIPNQAATLNAVYDTVLPTVLNVTSTKADGTFVAGTAIDVTVQFSEAVRVTGSPQLTLETGATDRIATLISSDTTDTLTFRYIVQTGDLSNDLDYVNTTALALNGGTIRDLADNNAVLTLPAPGAACSLGANKAIAIDAVHPTIQNTGATNVDGICQFGTNIDVTLRFSEAVRVTGTPQLLLVVSPTNRIASYVAGDNTNTLTFRYTVLPWDTASDLEYLSTNALSLNGGTIKDLAGNDAILTLAAPGAAGSLGNGKNLAVDGIAPLVSTLSGDEVTATFGVAMGAGGLIAGNYTISGDKGTLAANPTSVTLVSGNTYLLRWNSGAMVASGNITLTVASFTDAADASHGPSSALVPTPLVIPAMVPIGNPGNPPDSTGHGAVAYSYRIGTYEVTQAEYCAFLNAVAKTDTYGLWVASMSSAVPAWVGGINRSGSSGSYVYTVPMYFGNKPINWVSVYGAIRFCNWLHNGAKVGGDTENGVYAISAAGPNYAVYAARDANGRYFLPNEDEWYKAAYYDPNKGGAGVPGYWLFAVRYDEPTNLYYPINASTATDSDVILNPGPYVINSIGLNGSGQCQWNGGAQLMFSTVGGCQAPSGYGTYDQNGNVYEWLETLYDGEPSNVLRGGCFESSFRGEFMSTLGHTYRPSAYRNRTNGFRVGRP